MTTPTVSPSQGSNPKPQGLTKDDVCHLFGTISDSELADHTGLSRSAIRHARMSLGIEIASGKNFLSDEIIKALGTKSDVDLAKQSGRSVSTIRSARERRAIPRYLSTTEKKQNELHASPSTELLAALACNSNIKISKDFGISLYMIGLIRTNQGIAQPTREIGLPENVKLLIGSMSDTELARQTGESYKAIRNERIKLGIPHPPKDVKKIIHASQELLEALANLSNRAVAIKFDLAIKKIYTLRNIHNIPAPTKEKEHKTFRPKASRALDHQLECTDELKELLATHSITKVAKITGMTAYRLIKLRNALSITKSKLRYQPTPGMLADLVILTNAEVALKYNVTKELASKVRKTYAIPRQNTKTDQLECTDELKNLLATHSILEVSKISGIKASRLNKLRNCLSITKSKLRYPPPLGMVDDLAKLSNTEVALKYSVTKKWVSKVRKIYAIPWQNTNHDIEEKILPWLGNSSDRMVTKIFGCSRQTCVSIRNKHGIGPYEGRGRHMEQPLILKFAQEDVS